ncbi:MAG: YqaJ viral recombinase family protein [Pseudomonadota bacterium]
MTVLFDLTPEEKLERRKYIGGSEAGKIMSGEWYDLWREKKGLQEPDDLSNVLPVQLGKWTEEFNAAWYEKQFKEPVTQRGKVMVSRSHTYMRASLDGIVGDAIWEAKHVSGFEDMDTIVQRYMPQLHHNMLCSGARRAVLSVLVGTRAFERVLVDFDSFYGETLLQMEEDFWRFMEGDDAPPNGKPAEPPAPPKEFRDVDMQGNNAWAHNAGLWLANKDGVAIFKSAEKELKALVEADVGKATGHGIVAKRDKRGLSIKEDKNGR